MNNIMKQAREDFLIFLFLIQGLTVSILFLATLSLLFYGFIKTY